VTVPAATDRWLELAVECDTEAVEPVAELFARHGFGQGVVIEEPFTQEPDGDNLAVDPTRPVTVRTYLAAADVDPATLDQIRHALWHLGRMRHVDELVVIERREEDWANAWKAHYRVHRIGRRVVVRAPWHDYQASSDEVVVELDPGMAFGTGLHPSTKLCVLALEEEVAPGTRLLDIGTGSAVLAIAAILLGASHADAVDIEPVAVRAAQENAARNGVAARIAVAHGSVESRHGAEHAYPLVVANIIARILIELAGGIAGSVAPGGTLILSGVIENREAEVRQVFDGHGLQFDRRAQIEDWVALVYRRTANDLAAIQDSFTGTSRIA